MNLGGFIDTFKDAIARRVVEPYPPLYRPSENGHKLPRLLRKPLEARCIVYDSSLTSLDSCPKDWVHFNLAPLYILRRCDSMECGGD